MSALPQPEEKIDGYRNIPSIVFETMPTLLAEPCNRFNGAERELFLVGALSIISGMLPNYAGSYFGEEVGANLFSFIIGRYGTGKGALKWAYKLGEATHNYRIEQAKEAELQYRRDKADYHRKNALYNKGKLAEPPQEPMPPAHLKLFIPANTTKTAIVQLLSENDGRGIIFETEGDTLADMLKQDYGNFSDILRKTYHHERLSFFRRANNEDVEVPHPELSVLLSGTYDQVMKLMPSIDNGLFSRFMFYILDGESEFKNPFAKADMGHNQALQVYSEEYLLLYKTLCERQHPLRFYLSDKQQKGFVKFFVYLKEWMSETISDDMEGSVNRIALMTYRIAMIFTILRHRKEHKEFNPMGICCADNDLENARRIMDVLTYNATDVYEYLEKNGKKRTPATKTTATDDERTLCYRYHQQGMSNRGIAAEVFGNSNSRNKVKRILKDYGIE